MVRQLKYAAHHFKNMHYSVGFFVPQLKSCLTMSHRLIADYWLVHFRW